MRLCEERPEGHQKRDQNRKKGTVPEQKGHPDTEKTDPAHRARHRQPVLPRPLPGAQRFPRDLRAALPRDRAGGGRHARKGSRHLHSGRTDPGIESCAEAACRRLPPDGNHRDHPLIRPAWSRRCAAPWPDRRPSAAPPDRQTALCRWRPHRISPAVRPRRCPFWPAGHSARQTPAQTG